MCWSGFKTAFRQKIGLVLLFLGLISFLAAIALKEYQFSKQNSLSFTEPPQPGIIVEEGDLPIRIIISKVGIDLSVFPAQVTENIWEVSDEGVSYLLGSGIPGREGKVVIYGHNKNHLFGPMK
jgi:sortase (surface protein transpeptidase)